MDALNWLESKIREKTLELILKHSRYEGAFDSAYPFAIDLGYGKEVAKFIRELKTEESHES